MGRYDFLESMALADCALDVEGNTLDDLFETAARALAEVMVDPATVEATVARTMTLTAPALDLLLYDWLSELIALKDAEQLVFPEARVHVRPGAPASLDAWLRGGPLRPGVTALRADPKAVTFHQFALTPRNGGWRARLVIDI